MTEAKHSPLPWRVEEAYDRKRPVWFYLDIVPHGEPRGDVASVSPAEHIGGITRAECKANARFIARACNSHYALVEALEGLVEKHVKLVNSGDCGFWDVEADEEMIFARAALAAAKGEG